MSDLTAHERHMRETHAYLDAIDTTARKIRADSGSARADAFQRKYSPAVTISRDQQTEFLVEAMSDHLERNHADTADEDLDAYGAYLTGCTDDEVRSMYRVCRYFTELLGLR